MNYYTSFLLSEMHRKVNKMSLQQLIPCIFSSYFRKRCEILHVLPCTVLPLGISFLDILWKVGWAWILALVKTIS